MTDTDLLIRDRDERDPFDLYFPEYNRQLVAGHSNNLPNHGLSDVDGGLRKAGDGDAGQGGQQPVAVGTRASRAARRPCRTPARTATSLTPQAIPFRMCALTAARAPFPARPDIVAPRLRPDRAASCPRSLP